MGDAATTYDEFSLFHENAAEAGLPLDDPPSVVRVTTTLPDGRVLSGLRWGTSSPELVLVHGGGQNAHTWDTTLLALGRPGLAVDLPGHGHSGDVDTSIPVGPRAFAADVATMVSEHAPDAAMVAGMSLGGLTAMCMAAEKPELVRRLVMIDVTPGVNRDKASDVVAFLAGPESFESFGEILERTVLFNPTRSESSLRRGILHNATQNEEGRWIWRHQRGSRAEGGVGQGGVDLDSLWDDLGRVRAPVRLFVGDRSPVVDEDDIARFTDTKPDALIITVADAGHSIQGDQPVVLAGLLSEALA